MAIHPKCQKVQQVMEINFPIRFSVRRKRQVFARLFASYSGRNASLINVSELRLKLSFFLRQALSQIGGQRIPASLAIGFCLSSPFIRICGLSRINC